MIISVPITEFGSSIIGFLDTFTAANGTALSAHSMNSGQSYTIYQGGGTIESDLLESATSGTPLEAVANGGASNGSIGVQVTIPASGAYLAGVIMRASNQTTALAALLENNGSQAYTSLVALKGLV